MTQLELRNLVLSWLDDLNAGYFTASQVNTWLNNGQNECQKQLLQAGENYYLKVAQTSTVVNQQDYVLPDDFLKLNRLELVLSGTGVNENRIWLQPLTLNQQDIVPTGTGTPEIYILKKNRLTLYPIPDQALTLRLYYSYRIAEMTSDSDSPDVPEEFHEFIAIAAAMDGFVKDDRAPSNLIAKYQEYITRFKQMAEDRRQDRSRQIIVRDTYDYLGW